MSNPIAVPVKAVVDSRERAAIALAATRLESALGVAAGAPVTVSCQFEPSIAALKSASEPCVIITSMLPEVASHDEPWAQTAQRLREDYQALTAIDGAVVFVCTVFRHVPLRDSADHARLVRVRRLNLLAAELSRETGLLVIDLDRTFAAIGAVKLQTDYRLNGNYAAEAAAKVIALAVVSAGLDAYASFDVQDAAKLAIGDDQLVLATPGAAALDLKPSNVLALGAGRRKQVVATVVDTDSEGHAGWLVHLLFTGRLSPQEAWEKLRRSIARRGWLSSSAMVFAAFRRAIRGRERMGG
jgi:hypothetical protein